MQAVFLCFFILVIFHAPSLRAKCNVARQSITDSKIASYLAMTIREDISMY
jgi:hypothetical protein